MDIDTKTARSISALLHIIHSNEHDLETAQAERMRLSRKRSWVRADELTDKALADRIKQHHHTARYAALKLLEAHGVHVCGYGLPNLHRPDGADGPPVEETTKGVAA